MRRHFSSSRTGEVHQRATLLSRRQRGERALFGDRDPLALESPRRRWPRLNGTEAAARERRRCGIQRYVGHVRSQHRILHGYASARKAAVVDKPPCGCRGGLSPRCLQWACCRGRGIIVLQLAPKAEVVLKRRFRPARCDAYRRHATARRDRYYAARRDRLRAARRARRSAGRHRRGQGSAQGQGHVHALAFVFQEVRTKTPFVDDVCGYLIWESSDITEVNIFNQQFKGAYVTQHFTPPTCAELNPSPYRAR